MATVWDFNAWGNKYDSLLKDRRVVIIEVTPTGKAAVDRVGRSAETHLADVLAPLDAASRRRLQAGLTVLRKVFADAPRARC